MRVQVMMSFGCGHGQQTLEMVREVVRILAPSAQVEAIAVNTAEEAERLGFPGSPTVLVNGVDIDPDRRAGVGLGGRLYGLAGVPPRNTIESALRSARRESE